MAPNKKIIYFSKASLIICTLFSLVFAILKGTGAIGLSWWFILSPFITLYTLVFLSCIIMCLTLIIKFKVLKKYEKNTNIT